MRQLSLYSFSWRRISLLMVCLACHFFVIAQTKSVSGTIKSNSGRPLEGATILLKGTAQGTSSDAAGRFILPVSSDKVTIVVSMTGFTSSTLSASVGTQVNVTLAESLKDLDEVVVVGYGKQKRANVVGSVSQISSEQLKQAPTMNVTNMLAGRLPGLTTLQQSGRPGADDAGLYIRGISTYGASQSPMIMIDNVQRPSISNLDPNEIESITILKDAVSTAVYGLQATNGIILVTTKRGKNQKPTISYDGALTVNSNTRFPKFMNGADYMQWHNKATDMDNEYQSHINADPFPYLYSQDLIGAVRNGTNTNPLFGSTDWVEELVGSNSLTQNHSLNVRGGSDKVRYFLNAGLLDQGGVIKNTDFKRYNVRSNIDAELSKVFSVSFDLSARQELGKTPGLSPDDGTYMNPFYQAVRTLPNLPMYAENGLPTASYSNAGWVNPLASVEKSGYQDSRTDVFQSSVTFNVKIPWVKGLEMKLLTAYDKSNSESKGWLSPYTLMGRTADNSAYVPITQLSGITTTSLRQSYYQFNRKTFQPSISYNGQFGDHSVTALALYEWSQAKSNVFSTGASNFPLTYIHEINFGSKAPADMISPTGSSGINDSRAGLVTRINYGFKGKYLLEVANRFDASVNFTKENRWKAFPAAGIGWVVSKENFFDKISKTVNYLKLKASLGSTGNDKIPQFQYMQTYSLTTDPVVVIGGKPVSALYADGLPNTNLKWETSTTTNVGFESVFLNGLLGVDFEWFYRVTTDILSTPGSLYPSSLGGYQPSQINHGIVDNRGFDLQIRHRHNINKFQYGITANLNWAKNKIIRLNENAGLPAWQRSVGRSIGEKFAFIADGMYQNWEEAEKGTSPSNGVVTPGMFKYRDLNGDGRLTREDDMTFVGRSNLPELMYGLNIDMRYGGFDFSALLQGAALSSVSLAGAYEGSSGTYYVNDNTPFTKTFYGDGNSPYFLMENSWTPDNPNAEFPRLTANRADISSNNAHANSGWLRDGKYLRLKAIQLGYTVPSNLLNKVKIQQLRFYVSGFNLFTWDKLKYMDPEMPNVNNGFYPQQRMVSGGVNLTF
jgi:TonB-linked SusC/RagA family outer membrane protein